MNLTNDSSILSKPRTIRWSPSGIIGRRSWAYSPSMLLTAAALMAAALVILVPAYLVIRTVGAGQETLDLLTRASTLQTLLNTIVLAVSVTLSATFIAVPVAWLTVSSDLRGKRLWAILAALPLVLPSYVAAYIYMTILAPKGLMQQTLEPLTGVDRLPSLMGFPGAFLVLTIISYPFILLTVRAALVRMDPSLLEAARSLGMSPWRAFYRVTLPTLRPSIVAGGLLVALYVVRDFGAVTMWQYSTFTRIIYNRYLSYKLDAAAAMALVVVVMTLFILFLDSRSRGKARYGRLSSGAPRQRRPVKLGHWKWPAQIFLAALVFVSLILPGLALLFWLWRGWQQEWAVLPIQNYASIIDPLANLLQPAWNSLSVSLLAALLAAMMALPVAVLAIRRPSRLSRMIERFVYIGYALPGIVVALALVFFGINYASTFYQTMPMLLAGYAILFLPQAVGSQRASLLQVAPGLEEVARSLGQRPLAVFRKITLPLALPGILAGTALVFLTSMKELPATLILSPLGFSTLSSQVWSNINEAFFAQAAAPALLLLLLSSAPLAFLTLRDK